MDRSPRSARTLLAGLSNPFGVGFSVTLGGLVAFGLALALGNLSTILIYIALALFIALGLDPVVRWLIGHGIQRVWAIVIVFFFFALVMVGVLLLVIPTVARQIAQFFTELPNAIKDFMATDFFRSFEANFGDVAGNILNEVQKFLLDPGNIATIGGGVLQVGVGIATGISGLIIVIVLSLYFIASLPEMKIALIRLAPARNRTTLGSMADQITESIGGYVMGMAILAFINAVLVLILHLVLGLPFPALMAVVAFFITMIPLVGPVLFWIIGTAVALFTSPLSALIFAIAYVIYMQVEAYVITPRVMSRTISVPGSLVVIGAMVGGTLLGLLGALVAIPVTASVLLIIKQIVIPRQDAKA